MDVNKKRKFLTIGMAVYDDFDGVYFTIQALRIFHLKNINEEVEIIVVDNNPNSAEGSLTKNFVEGWAKQVYIPYTKKTSTSVRNEIFKNASGEYTLCLDPHILIEEKGISDLVDFYKKNPSTNDLIQGPMVYDDLKNFSTHFDPVWRDFMYGIWGKDKRIESGELFEIPMMGLGLFSCRTQAWQGFNEKFKGFGGEEGYIHEKFRRAGGKCICLPTLRWNHRFGRPGGPPYPNYLEDRIWNYFVGWLEIFKDPSHSFIQSISYEFSKKMPKSIIDSILQKAIKETLKT